jgi:hypothetical protein
LLKSTKEPREVLECFEVALADPTQVMRWLVKVSDRLQAWNELGSALDADGNSFRGTQSLIGVDLAKAAKVLEQLEFPGRFGEEVLKALFDGGLDDLAASLVAKLPLWYLDPWVCDWSKMGARALVGGAFKFVTALLRPRGRRVICVLRIAGETEALLRDLGRDATAAAFNTDFGSMLAGLAGKGGVGEDGRGEAIKDDARKEEEGSEEAFEQVGGGEVLEDDGSEEVTEGRRLVVKLRECCFLQK